MAGPFQLHLNKRTSAELKRFNVNLPNVFKIEESKSDGGELFTASIPRGSRKRRPSGDTSKGTKVVSDDSL